MTQRPKPKPKPKLGRPPAASSAETRKRILNAACKQFAYTGFDGTSNRTLAEEAGLTTGAIYHYFDSKLDIYRSVFADVQRRVYASFEQAVVGEETFVGQFNAVLEMSHQLNREDPDLARFLGTSRVDAARNPALADALRAVDPEIRRDFFYGMLDFGIATGEVDPDKRDQILAVVRTITTGLTDAVSSDIEVHRAAIDGVKALLAGKLLNPP